MRTVWLVLTLLTLASCCCQAIDGTRQPPPPQAVEAPKPPTESSADRRRRLEARIPLDDRVEMQLGKKRVRGLSWEDANLDQAATYLRTITGVNFYVSPKVREEMYDDVLITAELDDVSVLMILDSVITEPHDLRWEVREGVVWILAREDVEGPLRLRYYDVKDLVRVGSLEKLIEQIRTEVHPGYWEEDNVAIEARNGILIVRASRGVHDALDRFLTEARRKRDQAAGGSRLQKMFAAKMVNLAIKDQLLVDVIKTLQILTGFNLVIDPRVAQDVKANPVTALQLKDAPLTTALTMVAAAAGEGYVWTFSENVATLTHKRYAP